MKKRLKGLLLTIAAVVATSATLALGGCSEGTTDEFFCDHKFELEEVIKETSCAEAGSQKVKCTECGVTEIQEIEKLPHKEVYVPMKPATCLEDGATDGKKCTVCEEWTVAPAVIPALGHKKVIDKAVAPGCMETGLTAGSHCGRCEIVLEEQVVVPATGHNVVSDIEKEPTCFESGSTSSRYCANCETVFAENEYLANFDHNFENGYCTHCGMFELEQFLTMDSSKYNATAVSEGSLLEKGTIYRIKNVQEGREQFDENGNVNDRNYYNSYALDFKHFFSDDYKEEYKLYKNVSLICPVSNYEYSDGYWVLYFDLYYGKSDSYGMSGANVEDLHCINEWDIYNIGFVNKDNTYVYLYIPETVFTDGNITITLLAGEGMEKITLK